MIVCFNPISTKKFLKEKISLINGLGGKMVKELIKSKDIDEFQDNSLKICAVYPRYNSKDEEGN